jgi:hypothetical protein
MEIFVFGSNLAGRHGAGAALEALKIGVRWLEHNPALAFIADCTTHSDMPRAGNQLP